MMPLRIVVFGGWLVALSPIFGQTWTQTTAPVTNLYWHSIAASANGSRMAAVATRGTQPLDGPIYTSVDSGKTWISNAISEENWSGIASSADGANLLALVPQSSRIATSTNSAGSWTYSITPAKLGCIASSADGEKLVAGDINGSIYTTTNSGTTWYISPGTSGVLWRSVASSADGSKLLAVGQVSGSPTGVIYTSVDFGNTWISFATPLIIWVSAVSSANGHVLLAAPGGFNLSKGPLAVSTNSGQSWMTNSSPVLAWTAVASSADGGKLVATALAANGNQSLSNSIFTSTDFGATWTSNTVPAAYWSAVAASADGNLLVAGTIYGGIWISQSPPSTSLGVSSVGEHLGLSWTIPSTYLTLQQSADLTSWSNFTDAPILNLTNLQNQVSVNPTNGSAFYRLAIPQAQAPMRASRNVSPEMH